MKLRVAAAVAAIMWLAGMRRLALASEYEVVGTIAQTSTRVLKWEPAVKREPDEPPARRPTQTIETIAAKAGGGCLMNANVTIIGPTLLLQNDVDDCNNTCQR